MKQRITRCIAMILVIVVTCSYGVMAVGASPPTFSDVPESFWAYEQIEKAYAAGVITGTYYNEQTGERRFSPEGELTIAQWVVILTRAFYASEVDASTVTGTWYAKNDAVARDHNLYKGMGTVVMDSPCSRAEMAQLMYNVMVDKGAELPSKAELQATKAKIPDINKNSFVYQDAIATCYYLGLLVGTDNNGNFSGAISLNRGQSAVVYTRMRDALAALVDPDQPDQPDVPDPDGGWPTNPTEFKIRDGENVQNMMNRINAATPAYREGYLTNGEPISDSAIQAMLAEMKESMPAGTAWATGSAYRYASPTFGGGSGCYSFATSVSDALFGEDAPYTKHQNFDSLKVGDFIWVRTAADDGHIYVVMTNPDEDGYFDACDGNHSSKVSWTSYSNVERLKANTDYSAATYVYSRY